MKSETVTTETTETYQNYEFVTGQAADAGRQNPFWLHVRSPQARHSGRGLAGLFDFFPTREKCAECIARVKAQLDAKVKAREDKKAAKQKAAAEFKNPYKVGDLLNSSWGYEQTNVEFFQVIEVGKRSLKIRQVGSKQVEKPSGRDSGYFAPVKDNFLEKKDAVWVTIQIHIGWKGDVSHSVPSPIHGNLSLTTEESSHYVSWYY